MHVFYIYKTDKENKTIEIHELEILLFRCSSSATKAPTANGFFLLRLLQARAIVAV